MNKNLQQKSYFIKHPPLLGCLKPDIAPTSFVLHGASLQRAEQQPVAEILEVHMAEVLVLRLQKGLWIFTKVLHRISLYSSIQNGVFQLKLNGITKLCLKL